jgi:hypothetical protein
MKVVEPMFDELREAEPRERIRWRRYPRSGVQGQDGYTFDFGRREYDSELRFIGQWFSDRLSFIDANLLPRRVFSHPGGDKRFVEISAPNGRRLSLLPAVAVWVMDDRDPVV